MEENIVSWYYNYITERHLILEANDSKVTTCVDTGFLQGGVCSAKFWIIAFDPAMDIINLNGIFGQGFADDCAALLGGTDLNDLTTRRYKQSISWLQWVGSHLLTMLKLKQINFITNKKQLQNKLKWLICKRIS